YSLLLTSVCCDDAYRVTPRVSSLARCDRLVSEPLVIKKRSKRGANYGEASKELKEEGKLEESEEEADLNPLSNARSRPGPAKLCDSCESKVKPKRDQHKFIPFFTSTCYYR
ncbi:hypothetical protein Tco_1446030, partial [Tanacetum coccineum]